MGINYQNNVRMIHKVLFESFSRFPLDNARACEMQYYMMYDMIVFENLRFRPTSTRKFSKISTLDRFQKPAFLLLENAVYVWTEG